MNLKSRVHIVHVSALATAVNKNNCLLHNTANTSEKKTLIPQNTTFVLVTRPQSAVCPCARTGAGSEKPIMSPRHYEFACILVDVSDAKVFMSLELWVH